MDRSIELGFANIDLERRERTGIAEVIYGEGKSADQIVQIVRKMYEHGEEHVLITRVDGETAGIINRELEAVDIISNTYGDARIVVAGGGHSPDGVGRIAVVTGGTSDIPVAEEAARTAEFLGNEVDRIYDVGVAGLHRLMSKVDIIRSADVCSFYDETAMRKKAELYSTDSAVKAIEAILEGLPAKRQGVNRS